MSDEEPKGHEWAVDQISTGTMMVRRCVKCNKLWFYDEQFPPQSPCRKAWPDG